MAEKFHVGTGEGGTITTVTNILATLDPVQVLLVWGVIIAAAVLRAFTGFGFGIAAVPVFSLFMAPTDAVVLSVSLALAISLLTLRTYWGQYPLRPLLPMLGVALLGTAAGVLLLRQLELRQFQFLVGLTVIAACLVMGRWRPRPRQPRSAVTAATGLMSGLLNGAFAMPGPPVIVYAMATQPDPARSRSLLMTFFLFSAALALASYGVAGFVKPQSPWLFLLAFPAMYAGDKLGYYLFRRFGAGHYRRVALVVLFAVGVGITAKALS